MIEYAKLPPEQCARLGWECGRTWVDAEGRSCIAEGGTSPRIGETWSSPPGERVFYRSPHYLAGVDEIEELAAQL